MLELGPRELLTLGTVLAGLAATWGVVIQNSIKIISQDILSPQILKAQSERDGRNDERIRMLEERMNRVVSMHNGEHPPTTTKEHD